MQPAISEKRYALTFFGYGDPYISPSGKKYRTRIVLCECGNTKTIRTSHITDRWPKSCGCQQPAAAAAAKTKHGHYGTRTYRSWRSMWARCTDEAHESSKYYVGRGITFCERWSVFANFLSDMGERPKGMSLDRIDPNGNYEPSNCRWATNQEQQNNRRNNKRITINGETLNQSQWARRYGLDPDLVSRRLLSGWTPEEALGLKPRVLQYWLRTSKAEAA